MANPQIGDYSVKRSLSLTIFIHHQALGLSSYFSTSLVGNFQCLSELRFLFRVSPNSLFVKGLDYVVVTGPIPPVGEPDLR